MKERLAKLTAAANQLDQIAADLKADGELKVALAQACRVVEIEIREIMRAAVGNE